MGFVHAVVVMEHLSGKVEDRCMNTFTFQVVNAVPDAGDFADIQAALADFYNTVDGTTSQAISKYISPCIDRGAAATSTEFYDITNDLAGTPHGSPVAVTTWDLGDPTSGATSLPAELSIACSFHGNLSGIPEESGSTRPRARRRGRVYIGPLTGGTLENEAPTNRCRVATNCRNTIAAAGDRLMSDANTVWCVWSRADSAVAIVSGGFVDDAFDIQRRRGEDAFARSIWS